MAKKETQSSGDPFMDAVLKINTEMGSGAVMGGNEIIETERLSTGSLSLDIITGGGYGYGRIVEAAGPESSGKAQPLYSKILTPDGWFAMGEMRVGSEVIDPTTGKTVKVVGVYPQGVQDIWEITLADGSTVRSTMDHLWMVCTSESGDRFVETLKGVVDIMVDGGEVYLPKVFELDPVKPFFYAGTRIESVMLVERSKCQCIKVGSESSLYITDCGIVTHNTTVGIHGAISAQRAHPDKKVVIIDFEHALDRVYCENLGLDMDKVFLSQPSNGEEGLEIAERLISTGKVSYCLIDSVAAIVPKAEIEGEMGDNQIGLQARLMSKAMRKLTGTINKHKTVMFITNQIREKIGVMFGSNETTSGGRALKFFASIRLDVRGRQNTNSKDANGETTANTVKVKTVKNKLAPPFKTCEFDIEYGKGIDRASEVFTYAEAIGLIKRAGSWFSYGDTKLGQGAESVKALLRDNLELMDELETIIKDAYAIK